MLANAFAPAQRSDYYETSLFLTTSSVVTYVYLADIAYDDVDPDNPISTALRVGFAVHAPGQGQPVVSQYIFELTQVLASIYFSPFSPTYFRQSRQRGYAAFGV